MSRGDAATAGSPPSWHSIHDICGFGAEARGRGWSASLAHYHQQHQTKIGRSTKGRQSPASRPRPRQRVRAAPCKHKCCASLQSPQTRSPTIMPAEQATKGHETAGQRTLPLASAGLSSRHSIPRGPLRQLSKAVGMSSASGRSAISRTSLPSLQGARKGARRKRPHSGMSGACESGRYRAGQLASVHPAWKLRAASSPRP